MNPEQERWFVAEHYHGMFIPIAGPFREKSVANAIRQLCPRKAIGWDTAVISQSEALAADPESTNSLIEQSK